MPHYSAPIRAKHFALPTALRPTYGIVNARAPTRETLAEESLISLSSTSRNPSTQVLHLTLIVHLAAPSSPTPSARPASHTSEVQHRTARGAFALALNSVHRESRSNLHVVRLRFSSCSTTLASTVLRAAVSDELLDIASLVPASRFRRPTFLLPRSSQSSSPHPLHPTLLPSSCSAVLQGVGTLGVPHSLSFPPSSLPATSPPNLRDVPRGGHLIGGQFYLYQTSLTRQRTSESLRSWWSDSNLPGPAVNLHAAAKPLLRILYHRQALGIVESNSIGVLLDPATMDIYMAYLSSKYVSSSTKEVILKHLTTRGWLERNALLMIDSERLSIFHQLLLQSNKPKIQQGVIQFLATVSAHKSIIARVCVPMVVLLRQ
ncbi:hypothetical protein C8J57DRAFT_1735609, partial [Mycena rebaudengoi]